jgi:hypothetical protein
MSNGLLVLNQDASKAGSGNCTQTISTNQYKALFYAALALTEQPVIDVLVTGLPVDQFKDENTRKKTER